MYKNKKVYAIIGAAGSGKRMAAPIPKQFLKIGEKTILEITTKKFESSAYIDEIIIVTAKEYTEICCQFFHEEKQKIKVVIGGNQRQDSIWQGIQAIKEPAKDDILLIHDGARPFASVELIERVIEQTYESGAAIAAINSKDTIRHIEKGTLDRSKLFNVQTPQGFCYSIIKEAFEKAYKDGFYGTDDASLVDRLGYAIEIVPGEEGNIKITTPEDLAHYQKEKETMKIKVGSGYDVHKLVEGRKLILGGVEIPFKKGLLGHSDADVLVHALMDALLGALADGDIGKHFPDTDERYKGISSIKLLGHVTKLLEEKGYTLGNADITVICQKPKLAEYITEMRENIATTMKVDIDKISIKATTTEKLGFTGREEGIAAESVVLIEQL